MDVANYGKSMEVLVEGDNNDEQPCKKHSKMASFKASKTKLIMEVNA